MIAAGAMYRIRKYRRQKAFPARSSPRTSAFFIRQPANRVNNRPPKAIRKLDVSLSQKLNRVSPRILTFAKGPKDREQSAPSSQQPANRTQTALVREKFFSSTR